MNTSAMLSVKDVMERLNLSRGSIYRMIERGELTPVKIGKSVRFRADELNALLQGSAAIAVGGTASRGQDAIERGELHRLVDELPMPLAGELLDFARFLRQRENVRHVEAVRAALNAAPQDDESYTDRERVENAERMREYRATGGVSIESLMAED